MCLLIFCTSSTELYDIHISSNCFIIRHKTATANVENLNQKSQFCIDASATQQAIKYLNDSKNHKFLKLNFQIRMLRQTRKDGKKKKKEKKKGFVSGEENNFKIYRSALIKTCKF